MSASPRVSVVVPVYNPGVYIEPAIASILGQSLPTGEVEAIFVDDGSTDATPARLDRLAAQHPDTIHVIHIPPSGSPSRPRNLGIEAARGEYIQFLDADDELAVDALERVVAMADHNRSDIVVEKFASATIPRNQRLFKRSIEHTTLADMPELVDSSLGPAKLFRRSFLLAHGISFPEGWRLMEDQYFSLLAYLRAGVVSVAANRPCYFFLRRDDDGHLTSEPIDPDRHFVNLAHLVDLVEAETSPGALRDHIVRRLLRVEVLGRVGELDFPDLTPDAQTALFEAASQFVRSDRVTAEVVASLGSVNRIRFALLRDGRQAELVTMDEALRALEVSATTTCRWIDGTIEVRGPVALTFQPGGRPFVVHQRDGRWYFDRTLADDLLDNAVDVTAEVGRLAVEIILRAHTTGLEWHIKALTRSFPPPEPRGRRRSSAPAEARTVHVATATRVRIDPMHVGAGAVAASSGTWDVLLRISGLGLGRITPLDVGRDGGMPPVLQPALLGDPARIVLPLRGAHGLGLEIDPSAMALVEAMASMPLDLVRDGKRVMVELPMAAGPSAGPMSANLIVQAPNGDHVLPARLRARYGGVVADAPVVGLTELGPGPYPILLRLGDGDDAADLTIGVARIRVHGWLRVEGLRRQPMTERTRVAISHHVAESRKVLIERGRRLYGRLPARPRKAARSIFQRFR